MAMPLSSLMATAMVQPLKTISISGRKKQVGNIVYIAKERRRRISFPIWPTNSLSSISFPERGCHMIQSKGDANVDIVKTAVAIASFKTITVLSYAKITNLLVLLLHYKPNNSFKNMYLQSVKMKPSLSYCIRLQNRC